MLGAEISLSAQTLLAGYGCEPRGPYLLLDHLDSSPWQRRPLFVRGQTFTLSRHGERHCTGRHDLEKGLSTPCPLRATLGDGALEQCSACFTATGFNPAFYNAPHVSPQQRRRNREPHVVYLVSFGVGALKVGMTYAPRRLSRLLEQGARLGAIIASLPDADRARALEESVARQFGVAESVRAARKRHLLSVPFATEVARQELANTLALIAEERPEVDRDAPILALDEHYFGAERLDGTLTDLTETEPHAISGRCVGMIGDVIVTAQGRQRFALSVGTSVGCRVRLEAGERENRFLGQLGLPF